MTDLEKAIEILNSDNSTTCVLCKDGTVYISKKSGISPMLDLLEEKNHYENFSVADKIVGKAAAMLFIYAKVSYVFGAVMTKEAKELLEKNNIIVFYDVITEKIINRKKDGICPMEQAVSDINSPQEAFLAIKKKKNLLMKNPELN